MSDEDSIKWARLVTYRGDGWLLTNCQHESLFRSFKELFQHIKNDRSIIDLRSCASLFETTAASTIHIKAIYLLKQHMTSCFKSVREGFMIDHIYNWISFIKDDRIYASWSPTCQLGIFSQVRQPSTTVTCIGKLTRVYVGSRAYRVMIEGFRWSAVHDHLILGPLSLLNHACRKHCNIDANFEDDDIIVIRDVEVGAELLVEYADENYVISKLGLRCSKCCLGTL